MVVGLTSHWKLPIGYFLVAGLNAPERANLCTIAVQKLLDIGVTVTSLTCDGPQVNLSTLKHLGANLDGNNLDTQLFQDLNSRPIFSIVDMVHSVKNVRNAWKVRRVLKNSKGEMIDWTYLERLVCIQEREHLHCANKLTSYHLNFENQKMKVSLATQLFSRSVAKSLEFCRETLKLKDFEGSAPTQEFIQIMNDIFDFMNSKMKYGPGITAAVRTDNYEEWKLFLDMTEEYLLGLKNVNGKSMVNEDGRKTGFLGIVCNIHSVQNIYEEYVKNGDFEYLTTYKLSRDHLELFFALIRARFDNNPSPHQFKKTYRKILLGVSDRMIKYANCTFQDNTEIIGLIPSTQNKLDYLSEHYDLEDIDIEQVSNISQSDYKKNVVNYISGFIVKIVCKKLSCNDCISLLKTDPHNGLIRCKDYDNFMMYPSTFVTKLTTLSENVLGPELNSQILI